MVFKRIDYTFLGDFNRFLKIQRNFKGTPTIIKNLKEF